jgi:hypothetical protein
MESYYEESYFLNRNEDEIVIVSNSSSETESDYYSELESDNEYDEINRIDYQHFYKEKINGDYYIGICDKELYKDTILMASSVSPSVYFNYPNRTMIHYLYYYSGNYCGLDPKKLHIDIMKLHIREDGTYTVIIKTFWIRIIQRLWKKTFKERMRIIKTRINLQSLKLRECSGQWPIEIRYLPSVYGLLS